VQHKLLLDQDDHHNSTGRFIDFLEKPDIKEKYGDLLPVLQCMDRLRGSRFLGRIRDCVIIFILRDAMIEYMNTVYFLRSDAATEVGANKLARLSSHFLNGLSWRQF
jgi:hypothetical protein